MAHDGPGHRATKRCYEKHNQYNGKVRVGRLGVAGISGYCA